MTLGNIIVVIISLVAAIAVCKVFEDKLGFNSKMKAKSEAHFLKEILYRDAYQALYAAFLLVEEPTVETQNLYEEDALFYFSAQCTRIRNEMPIFQQAVSSFRAASQALSDIDNDAAKHNLLELDKALVSAGVPQKSESGVGPYRCF